MSTAGRKGRPKDQILKDRAEVAHLYLKGWTQEEIARKFGLSRQQIGYDLEAVRAEWLRAALVDFNAKKSEELARLDHLEREYWLSWEASKGEAPLALPPTEQEAAAPESAAGQEVGEALVPDTAPDLPRVTAPGDPRYLAGVQACIAQRSKLLGLNAPVETRLTGKDGGPVVFSFEDAVTADRELEAWEHGRVQDSGSPALPPRDTQVS